MAEMQNRLILLFSFVALFIFSSCASSPMIQPQINSLVVAGQNDYAIQILEKNPESYGSNNRLLYLLDEGMVFHLTGRYDDSIRAFAEAKKMYDNLYTISISGVAKTWLVNDNKAPYRGEDFERAMINVFQAINYAALGNIEGALVEARDVDVVLSLINRQYKPDQRNVYKEDAFIRFVMGIFYEMGNTSQDINDAYISYRQAWEIYKNDFSSRYNVVASRILHENFLAAAQWMGPEDFKIAVAESGGEVPFVSIKEKLQKSEIYLFEYQGFSPIKHQAAIPIPSPDGIIVKFVFPMYTPRIYESQPGTLEAKPSSGLSFKSESEVASDISKIAIESLNSRKIRIFAKAILRSGGKYTVERLLAEEIKYKQGDTAGRWFKYLASLYNITSEQADLRSWQTLPAEIHVARLILSPGEYDLYWEGNLVQHVQLNQGEKKFVVVRTVR